MSRFYIIGTKYGEYNNEDITPYLIEKQVIALGFAWKTDLSHLYNRNTASLKENLPIDEPQRNHAAAQLAKFLSLCPGDFLALKSVGTPVKGIPRLEIIAYAVVTERDGYVYRHDATEFPQGLGHTINVDFLEYNIKQTFRLGGYGQSIHELLAPEDINRIFGPYASSPPPISDTIRPFPSIKNTSSSEVKSIASYIRKATHNIIQQDIYNAWRSRYRNGITMEENYVDIIISTNNFTLLIEVKSYISRRLCIREGLGQLISYYQQHYIDKSNIILIIVGYEEPDNDDIRFIQFIQSNLSIPFKYISYEKLIKTIEEDNIITLLQ